MDLSTGQEASARSLCVSVFGVYGSNPRYLQPIGPVCVLLHGIARDRRLVLDALAAMARR